MMRSAGALNSMRSMGKIKSDETTVPAIDDSVRIYSHEMHLSLSPNARPVAQPSFGTPKPMLQTSQTAESLGATSIASHESLQKRRARRPHRDYSEMMASILDRTRQQLLEAEQEEDRRVEKALKHMSEENKFLDDVDTFLQNREHAKQIRKQHLFQDWQEKVYGSIQRQIESQISALSVEEISARRRALLEDYIRVSNEKAHGLFRDIIIEAEYDPLIARKHTIGYHINDFCDPVKLELNQKSASEIGRRSQRHELGRSTLDMKMWNKLDTTPYGRFDRFAGLEPPKAPSQCSRIMFDHYSEPNHAAYVKEMTQAARGKRMVEKPQPLDHGIFS